MTARLELVRRNLRVYRVAFSDLAGLSGVIVELGGSANKRITLRHIQIAKPSTGLTPYTLEKLSALSTGGTSSTPTPVPSRTEYAAADGVVKLFTAAPTKGSLIDQIQEIDIATGDVMNEDYLENDVPIWTLDAAAQAFAIVITVTSTINGYIEWSEEP